MRWIQEFSEGSRDQRELLGGKGSGIAEMTRVLGAERVPAGFTITTEACVAYMKAGHELPPGLAEEVDEALAALERRTGKVLGDPQDPLLVSVRSGARVSMPGMLDTILNLGLNDESVAGLARNTGSERFAWDSYRRFVQMFGNVVRGIPSSSFEQALQEAKDREGVSADTELDAEELRGLTATFKRLFEKATEDAFPPEPREQLQEAITAVFDSWDGERAVAYRRIGRIPGDWGTAVNVQQMVFGNRGETSGSGVVFSRDERTGEPTPSGDFLTNAQGEDVVAGTRDPEDLEALADRAPEAHAQLLRDLSRLESHYKDMQDVEFTIEEGRLFLLQTRAAKRPAQAAVRFAVDSVREGLLTREEALLTIDAEALEALLHPVFDPTFDFEILTTGIGAAPGAARGAIVLSASEAVRRAADGEDVILVRPFTEADDIAGFDAARGILTAQGGKASHAALVARGLGRPCVAGASKVKIDAEAGVVRIGEVELAAGELHRDRGHVPARLRPTRSRSSSPRSARTSPRCFAGRTSCGASACAPMAIPPRTQPRRDPWGPRGSASAGRSTCSSARTEGSWCGACSSPPPAGAAPRSRRPATGGRRRPSSRAPGRSSTRRSTQLGELQRADFDAILHEMRGLPVTVRLLDPPLHEFLPLEQFEAEVRRLEAAADDSAHRGPRGGRDRSRPAGGEPDAGDAGGTPRLPLSADLRDAGPGGDRGRRRGGGGRRTPRASRS